MKDIKKQQNTALKIGGLSDVVEVACGSSFNLVLTLTLLSKYAYISTGSNLQWSGLLLGYR